MQTQQLPTIERPAPPPAADMGPPPAANTAPPDWRMLRREERLARRSRFHEAGVPVWGVLLIAIGAVALLSNFGLNFGWLFGLALGTWFVYLGVRPTLAPTPDDAAAREPIHWWLVGIGLLIGLGSISSDGMDRLIFPVVLIVVGLGIVAQQAWTLTVPPQ